MGLYVEFSKHFTNVLGQIKQLKEQLQQADSEEIVGQITSHIKAQSEQLSDLLRLTRRLSFNCPIEYISDPFFILYA